MIEWTGLNLYQVMEMNIVEFLNLTCFNIDYNKYQTEQISKMKKSI